MSVCVCGPSWLALFIRVTPIVIALSELPAESQRKTPVTDRTRILKIMCCNQELWRAKLPPRYCSVLLLLKKWGPNTPFKDKKDPAPGVLVCRNSLAPKGSTIASLGLCPMWLRVVLCQVLPTFILEGQPQAGFHRQSRPSAAAASNSTPMCRLEPPPGPENLHGKALER